MIVLVDPLLDVLNDVIFFPANTTCTGLEAAPLSTVIVTFVGLEFAHAISTVMPPRVRAPFSEPVDQAVGSAGRRAMVSGMEVSATSGAWISAF